MSIKKAKKKSIKKVVNKVAKKAAVASPKVTKPASTSTKPKSKQTVVSKKKTTTAAKPVKDVEKKSSTKRKVIKRVDNPPKQTTTQVKKKTLSKQADKAKIKTKETKSSSASTDREKETPAPAQNSVVVTAPEDLSDTRAYWQDRYQDDRLTLLVRDPYWCFAYWDLSGPNQSLMIKALQENQAKVLLRTYDVTDLTFNGQNAHRFEDVEVSEEASNWYVNVWEPGRSYCVELGLLYPDGTFQTILRSNVVAMPRDSISPVIDEEWMVVDEMFDQLYQSAGAGDVGRSSDAITKYMLKRVRADVSSGGLASMGSEGGRPKPVDQEDFWLVAHAELIVYGATEPNAKLTIQGQPMTLNDDGTFSVRFALPDGTQVITIKAVNESETQERSITPIVEKRTE